MKPPKGGPGLEKVYVSYVGGTQEDDEWILISKVSLLQCVLQCVAVCCSVLQCFPRKRTMSGSVFLRFRCCGVGCNVLQCVAVFPTQEYDE